MVINMPKQVKQAQPKIRPTEAEILQALRGLITTVEIAGAAYGLARNSAYEAIRRGDIEHIRIGGKIVCPTAPIRKRLGLEVA
jgi:hypothetical protein